MSTFRRPFILIFTALAFVALASVALAGCGDGSLSKNDYIAKVNKANTRIIDATQELTSSGAKGSSAIRDLKKETDAAISDVENLKPPTEWKEYHEDMVASMNDASKAMEKLAVAIDKKDDAAKTQAIAALNTAGTNNESALAKMRASR